MKKKLCGDGVCDMVERSNTELCPKDCAGKEGELGGEMPDEEDLSGYSPSSVSGLSPSFGVHPSGAENYKYAKELGLDFNREGVYFIWQWINPKKDGKLKFRNVPLPPKPGGKGFRPKPADYDREREKLASAPGISLMANLCPFMKNVGVEDEVFGSEKEKAAYAGFVEKLVERYDGDGDTGCSMKAPDCYAKGDGQYPPESLIQAMKKNPVKTWQVCNQVTDACKDRSCGFDGEHAAKYAKVLKISYSAVKKSCPDCRVAIAGDSPARLYPPIFKALGGRYFDIADLHFFGPEGGYRNIAKELSFLKKSLKEAGLDPAGLKFWITEMSTYSGKPKGRNLQGRPDPAQTEKQQARELVKLFTAAYGEGVEKTLWAWGIFEGFGCECCIFDYTGLVYDGDREMQECDDEDTTDLGEGVKKLGYYSLKLLIEKVRGFTSIEKVKAPGKARVYELGGNGRTVYIAWNDGKDAASVSPDELGWARVKVTYSVPRFENGLKLLESEEEYPAFFDVAEAAGPVGLNKVPVFLEEYK